MRILSLYAVVTALAVALAVVGLTLVLQADAVRAVAWMGALAWLVQLALFAPLLALRRRQRAFYAAWGGGTLVRFGLLVLVAWWVWWSGSLPLAPSLLALAGFLFLMLLLEPVFFRMGLHDG